MAKLSDTLSSHGIIGLDTSIFIYQFEASLRYVDLATEALASLARGAFLGVTSTLTLMEIDVRPLQLGRPDVADEYDALLTAFPNLSILNITRPAARRAAQLRASYRLRPADALQLAVCIEAGATAFLTNDTILQRVGELDVVILENFLAEPMT